MHCPVCTTEAYAEPYGSADTVKYVCQRCGAYGITRTAETILRATPFVGQQVANAAGWLREHEGVTLNSRDIDFLRNQRSPSVKYRADKLLLEIYKRTPQVAARRIFNLVDEKEVLNWIGVTWSESAIDVRYLLRDWLMEHMGFISGGVSNTSIHATITPRGHEYLSQLTQGNPDATIGFCAMWFDRRLDLLWDMAISKAIEDAGYDPKRIDRHQHNNKIDDEIIAMIRRSKFVIADFTGNRGGVYFEAGFAIGISVPVIWTVRESRIHRVHFDSRQYNFLLWSPDKLAEFREQLKNRIEATIGRGRLLKK